MNNPKYFHFKCDQFYSFQPKFLIISKNNMVRNEINIKNDFSSVIIIITIIITITFKIIKDIANISDKTSNIIHNHINIISYIL